VLTLICEHRAFFNDPFFASISLGEHLPSPVPTASEDSKPAGDQIQSAIQSVLLTK
jgi:hypothetical protein